MDNMSKMNFSYTSNLVTGLQEQMKRNDDAARKIAQEAYENRQRMQKAIEQTAINTAETNVQLQKVVENQNEYIDVLKEQLTMQKKQIQVLEQQTNILERVFSSEQDGVVAEQEILELIKKQIDSSHPLWNYVKDKGGDVLVTGVTTGVPVIYGALKMYLEAKGIILP